jgi:phosphohistidine phosphatase SixA
MENAGCRYQLHMVIILLTCLFTIESFAQEQFLLNKGNVFIVRHSEKESGNDPVLSFDGYKRTGYLVNVFNHNGKKNVLDRIYVTQFRRTQLTADSLRLKLNIDTVHYAADNSGEGLLKVLIKYKGDQNILVIGHSNTIPVILGRLGINHVTISINDHDYDYLFMIRYRKGKPILYKRRFGDPAVAAENSSWQRL